MRPIRALCVASLALLLGIAGNVPGVVPLAATADTPVVDAARIAQLTEAMQFGPLISVIRDEGIAYGEGLDKSFLGGSGGESWRADVAAIYDPVANRRAVEAALLRTLSAEPDTLAAMEAFYASPLGARIARSEVDARRALLDGATQETAAVAWMNLDEQGTHRAQQIRRLVAAVNLVERNVEGTLNADLALYRGLAEGGGFQPALKEGDILARVADEEPSVRAGTEDWLYPYLALAYEPLSDAELDNYIVFLVSPAGQRAEAASFAAFDGLFSTLSRRLGLAVSLRMGAQEI